MLSHRIGILVVISALMVGLTAADSGAAPAAGLSSSSDARIIHLSDPHFTSSSRTLDGGYLIDNQNSPLKSAVLSDFLVGNKARLNANTVVITGDITDSGDAADYLIAQTFIQKLKSNGFDVYCVPGNHDCSIEGTLILGQYETGQNCSRRDNFSRYIGGGPYPRAVDLHGGWLILLDSLQGEISNPGKDNFAQGFLGPAQLSQLAADLDRLQADRKAGKKIAVCLHHSPFKAKGPHGKKDPMDSGDNNILDDAREFLSVISNKADCLLFGHTTPTGIIGQGHGWFKRQQAFCNIPMINCINLEHLPWYQETKFSGETGQVCAAANQDGRLAVFHIGTNANLHRNEQRIPNGGWPGQDPPGRDDGSGWRGNEVIGAQAVQMGVGQNQDGRLELFSAGMNGRFFHDWQTRPNGKWHGRMELGRITGEVRQIAVACNLDGRFEVFCIVGDGGIFHSRQTEPNDSRGWQDIEPLTGSSPALQMCVGRNQDGRLEIFYVGADNILYHRIQEKPGGGWSGEAVLGSHPSPASKDAAAGVCVGQNLDGRLEVFYLGSDNEILHNWQTAPNGGWHGEERLGGKSHNTGTQICVGENRDGRLEVFYAGTNSVIYHNWQTTPGGAEWAGEEGIHGLSDKARQICVARNLDGRLEIFYIGKNGQLFRNFQTIPNAAYPITVIDLERSQREVYNTGDPDAVTITAEHSPRK